MSGAVPGYWMNETSGVLAPAVRNYLNGRELNAGELAVMRSYLHQWVDGFYGADVAALRARLPLIATTEQLRSWFISAVDAGIDPL